MDIHVDSRGREGNEKDDGRKLVAGEGIAIGIQDGFINCPIFYKSLIDIKINSFSISL